MFNGLLTLIVAGSLAITLFSCNVLAQDRSGDTGNVSSAPTANAKIGSINHVGRAFFTSKIQNREPADTITSLNTNNNKIYFFSELIGLGGHTVIHRWEYQGKTMGEIKFDIGGPRWRVWSSKILLPQWTGEWRVSIIDDAGNELGESVFNYAAGNGPVSK